MLQLGEKSTKFFNKNLKNQLVLDKSNEYSLIIIGFLKQVYLICILKEHEFIFNVCIRIRMFNESNCR